MMSFGLWIRILVTTIGLVALTALIWIVGPLLGVGDIRPFEAAWVRLMMISLFVLLALVLLGIEIYKRRKATEHLEEALTEAVGEDGDGQVLGDKMKDALATLRKSTGKGADYLYDLPWYVIIGPPGSGKTTALINSGLKFPLAQGSSPQAIAGVGGTRFCDWWFTEEAVLIDTAGRYTTQDSDAKADKKSWLAFLDLLKNNRPKQPINGVIVAISVEDLLIGKPEEINAHADAIRARLLDMHEHLKVDFPVYALFTKGDMLAGFQEFFGNLNEASRRVVWGHTFQTSDRSKNMIGEVPAEFDALVHRLNEEMTDRLQEEATPTARVMLYGFPAQVAALKRQTIDFLTRIFEPTRYHVNATLRGFYITSGTQQGTPIDQMIGALAKSFGTHEVSDLSLSGAGKSYFLTDLIKKVIIGEAGWVSTNMAAIRRAFIIKSAAYVALGAVSLLLVGGWVTSYARNSALIRDTQTAVTDYRRVSAKILEEPEVKDREFSKILEMLGTLRSFPAGFSHREDSEPVLNTLGLSQWDRINDSSENGYHTALERVFRSRLIWRLEEQLQAKINEPAFVYEALKAYKMVGGERYPVDEEFLVKWMERDWADDLYKGPDQKGGREALREHLAAMLKLGDGRTPLVGVNPALVAEAERTLARLNIVDRAYEMLVALSRDDDKRDWIAARRGGADFALVFEASGQGGVESVRVPYFYTYDGFRNAFMAQLQDVAKRLDEERWVLGELGNQQAMNVQYQALAEGLLARYSKEFEAAWKTQINRLRIKPLTVDKPRYSVLQAAASATSPLKQLLDSIQAETKLSVEREKTKEQQVATDVAKAGAKVTGTMAADAVTRNSRWLYQMRQEIEKMQNPKLGQSGAEPPGLKIEQQFKPFHAVLEGEGGKKLIDQLIQSLSEIYLSLSTIASNAQQAPAATANMQQQINNLRGQASRMPEPFKTMIINASNTFEGDVSGSAIAQLRQALAEQVTRQCIDLTANRFPMLTTGRDVAIGDFSKMFGPNGTLDAFFQKNLASYADTSQREWKWRAASPIGSKLSPESLRQFQRGAEIRQVFFSAGGAAPALQLAITPQSISGAAQQSVLDIGGAQVQFQSGMFPQPQSVQWPGGNPVSKVWVLPDVPGQLGVIDETGPWSLFRLLRKGSALHRADGTSVTFRFSGGREARYDIKASTSQNPFQLPALTEFKCPQGL